MTLTLGSGPLSPDTDGTLELDEHGAGAFVQPYPRRVRAVVRGATVLDTESGVLLHRPGRLPALWVPEGDVDTAALPDADALQRSSGPLRSALEGFVSLPQPVADRWCVEDEPVYGHFKDPYHRVDVLSSSRQVVVRMGDETVAETRRPKLLFETGLPVRYYVPWADVRLELLERSDTVSECPYKGDGQHWHVGADEHRIEDAAWSLPHPLAEGAAAIEHVCFYADKLEVTVDGRRVEG